MKEINLNSGISTLQPLLEELFNINIKPSKINLLKKDLISYANTNIQVIINNKETNPFIELNKYFEFKTSKNLDITPVLLKLDFIQLNKTSLLNICLNYSCEKDYFEQNKEEIILRYLCAQTYSTRIFRDSALKIGFSYARMSYNILSSAFFIHSHFSKQKEEKLENYFNRITKDDISDFSFEIYFNRFSDEYNKEVLKLENDLNNVEANIKKNRIYISFDENDSLYKLYFDGKVIVSCQKLNQINSLISDEDKYQVFMVNKRRFSILEREAYQIYQLKKRREEWNIVKSKFIPFCYEYLGNVIKSL